MVINRLVSIFAVEHIELRRVDGGFLLRRCRKFLSAYKSTSHQFCGFFRFAAYPAHRAAPAARGFLTLKTKHTHEPYPPDRDRCVCRSLPFGVPLAITRHYGQYSVLFAPFPFVLQRFCLKYTLCRFAFSTGGSRAVYCIPMFFLPGQNQIVL
jgi:hypothetical protein